MTFSQLIFSLCADGQMIRRPAIVASVPVSIERNNNKLLLSFFLSFFRFCFLFICVANRNIRLQLHTFPLFSLLLPKFILFSVFYPLWCSGFFPLCSCLFYFDLFSEEIFKFPLQIQYSQICLSQRVSSYPSWCVCVCVCVYSWRRYLSFLFPFLFISISKNKKENPSLRSWCAPAGCWGGQNLDERRGTEMNNSLNEANKESKEIGCPGWCVSVHFDDLKTTARGQLLLLMLFPFNARKTEPRDNNNNNRKKKSPARQAWNPRKLMARSRTSASLKKWKKKKKLKRATNTCCVCPWAWRIIYERGSYKSRKTEQ